MTKDEALHILNQLNKAEYDSQRFGLGFPGGFLLYEDVLKGGSSYCVANTKDNLIFIQALRDLADILEEIA